MCSNKRVWTGYKVSEEDISLMVNDVKNFRPVAIVGKPRTGKNKFIDILKNRLGETIYINERDRKVYEQYLNSSMDDELELFVDMCEVQKCNAIIVDQIAHAKSVDSLLSLLENRQVGIIIGAFKLEELAIFGMSLDDFTIVKLDTERKGLHDSSIEYTYEIIRN